MPKKHISVAICYDFDGTLAPGNMQERVFIPEMCMTTKTFVKEVKAECARHNADEILIYIRLMLQKALQAQVTVRKNDFETYGKSLSLFSGVEKWFDRI